MRKRLVVWLSVASFAAAVGTYAVYAKDMRRAHERTRGRSQVLASPYGDIEYAEGGDGLPVLVVHGSGGGFDQGALVAGATLTGRFHWIAPSRFGYLRSTFVPGATFDEQAHAYAALLDALQIDRVAVVALSHGGPSALLFAVLHPERVSSLTLLSAGVASSTDASQSEANQKGDALTWVFQRDYRYWAITTAFRSRFLSLIGATGDVIANLTPDEHDMVNDVVEFMNPVSERAAGVRFDNLAAMPNERIAAIQAPTLILHARDDTLQLFHNAEFAASTIPNARLVAFDRGGHVLVAVEREVIRPLVEQHILDHANR